MGIILFFFDAENCTGLIIHRTNQLHALMLAIGGNESLFSFEEPGTANGLVIMDHLQIPGDQSHRLSIFLMLERFLKLTCLAFWDPFFEVYKSVVYSLIPLNAGDWKRLFVIGYDHVPFFFTPFNA